jgi:hypothetical protein
MNNELVHTNHLSSEDVIMISIVYLHISILSTCI